MADIFPFRAVRPVRGNEEDVSELPYDVVSLREAKESASGNPLSFFHVIRPEIDLPEGTDPYDEKVYKAGKDNLDSFIEKKTLVQDNKPNYYLYTQVREGRTQTGLVSCVSIDDYIEGRIKKHEHTIKAKESDRTRHLDILNANTGLVFLFYREDGSKEKLFEKAMKMEPEYSFTTADGVSHTVRLVDDEELIASFTGAFAGDNLYVADGHHRAASAASVGRLRREEGKSPTEGEYNRFMTVLFPHSQLEILAYNRAVKGLNGHSEEDVLKLLNEKFTVVKNGIKKPERKLTFSMYLGGSWYTLEYRENPQGSPAEKLDVSILQKELLEPVLGINDPRTESRISFIGGIRGTGELERLVDSGEYSVAFSLYPTSITELMDVSDNNEVMPPKSTWFEPKLRSGLFVHLLD
jgi:uncharacterized protein (DUF1015 family)